MFIATFDVPPLQSETVGARRQRLERERRASGSTNSSGNSKVSANSARPLTAARSRPSTRSANASDNGSQSKTKDSSRGFGLFKGRKRVDEDRGETPLPPPATAVAASTRNDAEKADQASVHPAPSATNGRAATQNGKKLPSKGLPGSQRTLTTNPHSHSHPPPPSKELPAIPAPSPIISAGRKGNMFPDSSETLQHEKLQHEFKHQSTASNDDKTSSVNSSQATFAEYSTTSASSLSTISTYHDILSDFTDSPSDGWDPAPLPHIAALRVDRTHPRLATLPAKAYSPVERSQKLTESPSQEHGSQFTAQFEKLRIYDDDVGCQQHPAPTSQPTLATDAAYPPPLRPRVADESPSRTESALSARTGDTRMNGFQGPFARAVAKMENAGLKILSARLAEEWESIDDEDSSYQEEIFEKRLWALTAYQRLTQGKHLQSPIHEVLTSSERIGKRRILHVHGSLADGWTIAARYPAATVYTISEHPDEAPTSYPPPLNHHTVYSAHVTKPCPFPDNYFDAVYSRSATVALRADELPGAVREWTRVLKPGGHLEMLALDPALNRQGRALATWVDAHLTARMAAHGLPTSPADAVLSAMETSGLESVRRARIALATTVPPKTRPAPGSADSRDSQDIHRMMVHLGRNLYQDLYGRFMRGHADRWFWADREIRTECERLQTKMILVIACGRKPDDSRNLEAHLTM